MDHVEPSKHHAKEFVGYVRRLFFEAIRGIRPEISKQIYDQLFINIPKSVTVEGWSDFEAECLREIQPSKTGSKGAGAEVRAFSSSLRKLLTNLGLSYTWCAEIVMTTLHAWLIFESDRQEFLWAYPEDSSSGFALLPPPLGLPVWDPGTEPEHEYIDKVRQRIDRAFETLIEIEPITRAGDVSHRESFAKTVVDAARNYCSRVKKHDLNRSVSFPIYKDWPELHKHVEWAVRWHVMNDSLRQIAEPADASLPATDAANVSRQAKKILRIIEIAPRKKGGRPIGSSDSAHAMRQIKTTRKR